MDTSDLGKRMKGYEAVSKKRLMKRTPVAIRLDGRAFHTFCKGMDKPFDGIMVATMQETMEYLCKNIQGCVFGYTQSDEITLILTDYETLETAAWFDYEIQKVCSISSSMATIAFNNFFYDNVNRIWSQGMEFDMIESNDSYWDKMWNKTEKFAMFDSRCFNIPKEEVANLLYWRQLDAMRNSIQSVGQANFSHKELQNKSCKDIIKMLADKNIVYSDLATHLQRGTCCYKKGRNWIVDCNIPVFIGEGRNYVERHVYYED